MKYPTYISLFFIATLLLTSCKKDDVENDSLIGVWKIVKIIEGGKELSLTDCELKGTIELKADYTYVSIAYYIEDNICTPENLSGKWEKVGSNIIHIIDLDYPDEIEKYTYTFKNDELTFDEIISAGDIPYKIVLKKVN